MPDVASLARASGPSALQEQSALRRWWGRWWFAICATALIIASDYKYRVRPPEQAVQADVDAAIMIELAIYGLVALYLAQAHVRSLRRMRLSAPLVLLLFYVGLIVLSLTYTPFFLYGAVRAGQMVLVVVLVLSGVVDGGRAAFHRFAHSYLVLVGISAVYGVIVPSVPVNRLQEGRFTWLAIHPTVSGVLAGIATIVGIAYLFSGDENRPGPMWRRGVYVLLLALSAGALLGSQTRGAVLGGTLGVLVFLLTRRGGRAVIDFVTAIGLGAAAVFLAFSDQVLAYFQRGEDAEQIASLNSRTDLWALALDAAADEPLFGVGTTAARGIFYDELGLGGGHNAAVNVAVELGLFGLLCWAALVGVVISRAYRLPRGEAAGVGTDRSLILAVMTFLVVNGVFYEGAGAVTNVAALWFFVCVGWVVVAARSVSGATLARGDGVVAGTEPGRHQLRRVNRS